eukprot:Em0011g486a
MSGEVIARRGLEVVGGSQEKLAGSGRKDPYTFKLMRCNIDSMKMLLKGVKRTEVGGCYVRDSVERQPWALKVGGCYVRDSVERQPWALKVGGCYVRDSVERQPWALKVGGCYVRDSVERQPWALKVGGCYVRDSVERQPWALKVGGCYVRGLCGAAEAQFPKALGV